MKQCSMYLIVSSYKCCFWPLKSNCFIKKPAGVKIFIDYGYSVIVFGLPLDYFRSFFEELLTGLYINVYLLSTKLRNDVISGNCRDPATNTGGSVQVCVL